MTHIVNIFTIIYGQDDNFDYTTINLNHGYGNDFELDHLQDLAISKGVDRVVIMMMMMAKLMTMTSIVTIFTIIDGQDDDFDLMTINLNLCYGNIQSYSVIFRHVLSYSVIVIFSHIQ